MIKALFYSGVLFSLGCSADLMAADDEWLGDSFYGGYVAIRAGLDEDGSSVNSIDLSLPVFFDSELNLSYSEINNEYKIGSEELSNYRITWGSDPYQTLSAGLGYEYLGEEATVEIEDLHMFLRYSKNDWGLKLAYGRGTLTGSSLDFENFTRELVEEATGQEIPADIDTRRELRRYIRLVFFSDEVRRFSDLFAIGDAEVEKQTLSLTYDYQVDSWGAQLFLSYSDFERESLGFIYYSRNVQDQVYQLSNWQLGVNVYHYIGAWTLGYGLGAYEAYIDEEESQSLSLTADYGFSNGLILGVALTSSSENSNFGEVTIGYSW